MPKKYYADTNKTKLDIDGTAVNSDKLGGIVTGNYYHTGNLPPAGQGTVKTPDNHTSDNLVNLGQGAFYHHDGVTIVDLPPGAAGRHGTGITLYAGTLSSVGRYVQVYFDAFNMECFFRGLTNGQQPTNWKKIQTEFATLSDPTTQQAIDDLKAAGVNNDTMTAATFIDLQTPGGANQKTKEMKEIIDEVAEQYSLEFEFLVSKVLVS